MCQKEDFYIYAIQHSVGLFARRPAIHFSGAEQVVEVWPGAFVQVFLGNPLGEGRARSVERCGVVLEYGREVDV